MSRRRTRSGRPTRELTTVRRALALALVALAGGAAACGDVRSLSPALTDRDAIELPALEGRWGSPEDSGWLEIARLPGTPPTYRVRGIVGKDSGGVVRVDSAGDMYDGRVGRVAGHLVMEVRPPASDTALQRAIDTHGVLLLTAYSIFTVDASATELRLERLRADTALARVRSGRCATPYARDTTSTLTLTGDTRQVRRAYACLLAGARALDTAMVLPRMPANP